MDVDTEPVHIVWDGDEVAPPRTELEQSPPFQSTEAAQEQSSQHAGSGQQSPRFSEQSAFTPGKAFADADENLHNMHMHNSFDFNGGEATLEEAVCIVFDYADIPVLSEDEQPFLGEQATEPGLAAALQPQQQEQQQPALEDVFDSHVSTVITNEEARAVPSEPVTNQSIPVPRRPVLVRRRQMYQMVANAAEAGESLRLKN